jgi:O-antigen ligase
MWTLVFTTLGFWKSGTDPVNLPKLLLLGAFSGLALGNLVVERIYKENKILLLMATLFLTGLTVPLLFSSAPLVQQIYGVSGRNTGFLAYLFLTILFISAATLPRKSDYQTFPRAILIAGYGSAFLCTLEILGFNPVGANNTYDAIIGTLGNPNFISAFSAMIAVGAFALTFNAEIAFSQRLVFFVLSLLSVFMVYQSKSFQGFGATFIGFIFVILSVFFFKRAWLFFYGILSLSGIAASFAILGLLEKGPFASVVYQYTLPIRIEYWQAGLRMFFDHPFTGVGLNSYGDWYRFARDSDALKAPGGDTTSNVAHNIYIDFAAGGGLLTLISFTLLFGITFFYLLKALRKLQKFDPLFIAVTVIWLVYLVTAFFSIDQLGLAAWGWVIGGAIIGISRNIIDASVQVDDKSRKKTSSDSLEAIQKNETNALVPQLLLLLLFIGLAFPPLKADLEYAKARELANVQVLIDRVAKWPQDQSRYSESINLLFTNSFRDEALSMTYEALQMFPRSSVLWEYVYLNPEASGEKRNQARERLRELDPLNPLILELKKI